MRAKGLILLLFILPFITFAQTTITGKVVVAGTQTGLEKVNVFLSNSSFGTETTDDGTFRLTGVKPGQYDLVASSIGYKDFTQTILVGRDPISLTIEMDHKMNQLRGVVISSNADWKKNYELFKKDFIGTSGNAKSCVVVNPHTVNIINHGKKHLLEAWSNDFLIVDNKALGYRVKFLIDTFSNNGLTGIISWEGKAVFQELPGNEAQKKLWKLRREETYYGSSRHFFRSLYSNTLKQDGFIMLKLTRQINPDRPPEDLILQKIKAFKTNYDRDSLNYWIGKENLSKYANEHLQREPLQPYQIFTRTEKPGLFILSFTDCLYVIYTKRREETDFKDLYRPLDMENFETSVLTLREPYAVFDMNGVVFQGTPLNEGTWSKAKLAELLPLNYAPGDDQ